VQSARVLVLGATFKENVSDIRNSKVADVVKELQSFSVNVDVHDPHASSDEVMHEYGFGLTEINGTDYDAVILAVSHDQFKNMDEDYLLSITKPHAVIYDLKGIYRNKIKKRTYWTL
jgi:UDP-N-acetyl-D-galactosamine dehydrogenase